MLFRLPGVMMIDDGYFSLISSIFVGVFLGGTKGQIIDGCARYTRLVLFLRMTNTMMYVHFFQGVQLRM